MRIIDNKKKCIALIAVLVLVVLYVSRVVYVNVTAAKIPVDTYTVGEEFEYKDFTYCVKSYDILDKEQLLQVYNTESGEENTKYIVTQVDIKYNGNQSKVPCDLLYCYFQSGGWGNGQDLLIFNDINKGNIYFDANEEKTLVAVGILSEQQFSGREWKNLDNRKYEMVVSTYPRQIFVELN